MDPTERTVGLAVGSSERWCASTLQRAPRGRNIPRREASAVVRRRSDTQMDSDFAATQEAPTMRWWRGVSESQTPGQPLTEVRWSPAQQRLWRYLLGGRAQFVSSPSPASGLWEERLHRCSGPSTCRTAEAGQRTAPRPSQFASRRASGDRLRTAAAPLRRWPVGDPARKARATIDADPSISGESLQREFQNDNFSGLTTLLDYKLAEIDTCTQARTNGQPERGSNAPRGALYVHHKPTSMGGSPSSGRRIALAASSAALRVR